MAKGDYKRLQSLVSTEIYDRVKSKAKKKGKSVSRYVKELIVADLVRKKKKI